MATRFAAYSHRMVSRQLVRDAALPAAIAALGAVELTAFRGDGWTTGIALEVLSCALLVFRRRVTLVTCTAACLVVLAMPWVGPQLDEAATPILILFLAMYGLARWIPSYLGATGVVVVALALVADYLLVDRRSHDITDLVFASTLLIPPYVFGRVARKLAVQAELLARQQEMIRAEAVKAERTRIARDLHDVIAHSISAMVVQTSAAQDLVRTDPERAEQALAEVAATGRRALSETGQLLRLVRDDADELGLEPAPGLARLPELVESFRGHGLVVDLEVDGPVRPLPVGVDLSAYRIVQEALTNALKYAADRTASLRLTSSAESVAIHAENRVGHRTVDGSGLGLVGMAERVALVGGSLTHGPTDDGRFVVSATLPIGDPA